MTDTAPASSATVHLVGRVGARIDHRVLPSGDELALFTLIVDRPARATPGNAGARVDAIPCRAVRAQVRRRALSLTPGTWIEAEGTLHRRFWRTGTGLGSAMEVEVTRLRSAS